MDVRSRQTLREYCREGKENQWITLISTKRDNMPQKAKEINAQAGREAGKSRAALATVHFKSRYKELPYLLFEISEKHTENWT